VHEAAVPPDLGAHSSGATERRPGRAANRSRASARARTTVVDETTVRALPHGGKLVAAVFGLVLLTAPAARAYVGLCCGRCGGNMPMNIPGGGIPHTN
jgi:hypothetical protein